MIKQFPVRYGRNYKVVLAIVLPPLLIAPFILWMQQYPDLEEWKIWTVICIFLAFIISLGLWLTLRVYPPAQFSINNKEISLTFDPGNFIGPSDFRFNISDITSFTQNELMGNEYYIFETRNPDRKFQISAASYELEDQLAFDEAMMEISEMVNNNNS